MQKALFVENKTHSCEGLYFSEKQGADISSTRIAPV